MPALRCDLGCVASRCFTLDHKHSWAAQHIYLLRTFYHSSPQRCNDASQRLLPIPFETPLPKSHITKHPFLLRSGHIKEDRQDVRCHRLWCGDQNGIQHDQGMLPQVAPASLHELTLYSICSTSATARCPTLVQLNLPPLRSAQSSM